MTGTVSTISGCTAHGVGITTDGANLYTTAGLGSIMKISLATGVMTTLPNRYNNNTDDNGPYNGGWDGSAITTDGSNLYVADTKNNKISKIVIASGQVSTLAGSGSPGNTDAIGAAASFATPYGITTDGINLYVADTNNHEIRKIVIATGEVTTVAGSSTGGSPINCTLATTTGSASYGIDGTGVAATFCAPRGITTDGSNLYVADTGSHKIRKIVIATGVVTTLAGSGLVACCVDGIGAAASFFYPEGITTDGSNIYVFNANYTVRKIVITTGAVTTIAGSGSAGYADGIGTAALFEYAAGIVTDGQSLYVPTNGTSGSFIRKIQ